MTLTVLVPAEEGVPESSGSREVRLVRYRPDGPLPPEAAEAEVLVPPFLGALDLELVGRLPRLRLVQLLTASAEAWVGRLPDGVALSTARGAHGGATAEWVLAVLLATYRHLPPDALLAELERGRLHAALDVTDPEPLPAEHPLWHAPNLLLTPHVGGSVSGRHQRAFAVALEQIAAFAAGQDPPNIVSGSY